MKTVLWDDLELEFDDYEEEQLIFEDMFDNGWENKKYIVTGDIGLWDGVRKGVYIPRIFHSIIEAIYACNNDFNGYVKVVEENYGKMKVYINHHDGNNDLEIRELTKLGNEMWNNCYDIASIINKKGATKNIRYVKNYM